MVVAVAVIVVRHIVVMVVRTMTVIGVRRVVVIVPRVVIAVVVTAIVAVISVVIIPIRVVAVRRVPIVVVIVPIRAVMPSKAPTPVVVTISVVIVYGDWRNFNFVFAIGKILSVVVVAETLQAALIFARLNIVINNITVSVSCCVIIGFRGSAQKVVSVVVGRGVCRFAHIGFGVIIHVVVVVTTQSGH